jgi:hypothetical protein
MSQTFERWFRPQAVVIHWEATVRMWLLAEIPVDRVNGVLDEPVDRVVQTTDSGVRRKVVSSHPMPPTVAGKMATVLRKRVIAAEVLHSLIP